MTESKLDITYKSYKTIECFGESEVVEKKSRFIGRAYPVENEASAMDYLEETKKFYRDARHHVFAYQIGKNYEEKRASDGGEPSGTAGQPTLDVIEKGGITNVIVIVTRYFGGTLLGAGGLVRAYGKAAKECVINGNICEMYPYMEMSIGVDYTLHGKIQYELLKESCIIDETLYTENVTMKVLVPLVPFSKVDEIVKISKSLTAGKVDISELNMRYRKIE